MRPRRRPWFSNPVVVWLAIVLASALCFGEVGKEVSVPVQVVTAESLENLPFCGRTVLDLTKIPTAPGVNVSRGQITVPESANTSSLLNDIQVRAGDGILQPASGPICFENIEVLKQPMEFLYGNSTAGTINVTTSKPNPSTLGSRGLYRTDFFTSPLEIPGQMQVIRGPFDGKGPGTSVDVGGKPGFILAETPQALYWTLPDDAPHGSVSITVRDAGRGATFPVYILGLAMSADRLKLLRGESTKMQATVFGPELLPPDAWKAGDVSDIVDYADVAKKFPDFKIPKPGEPGVLFFRLDNASSDTVTMKPSKNESFVVNLDRGNFSSGPYTYNGVIQSKKAGGFVINGKVVAFFAPIPGKPLPPQTVTGTPQTVTPPPAAAGGTPPPPTTPTSGGPQVAQAENPPTPQTTTCPKKGDDCAELRRRWEQLEQEATAARSSNPGGSDQVTLKNEAAALEQSAANDRAYAAKLRQQAAAYRELAANNRADASKNHQRAKQWPADHEYHKGWEAEAAQDEARAAEYDAEAQHLSAQADAVDAQAAGKSKQASQLNQGIDPTKVKEIEDKQKAADEAKAAYNACLEKVAKDCPVEMGKYSLSMGLSYKWSRPDINFGTTYSTPGTTTRPPQETPNPPASAPPQQPSSTHEEPACTYQAADGWFSPSQGVWQDDMTFEDRPGKQLTRVDIPNFISYVAELPMIKGRDTVVTGVHHYQRAGKRVEVNERPSIVLKGETNCTEYDTVRFKFTITGPGQGGAFVVPDTYMIKLHGKPQAQMEPFKVEIFSHTGFPRESTFKFGGAGPYAIQADVIKTDGSLTGLQMRVTGDVVETTGPVVHFVPIAVTAGGPNALLENAAKKLATDSAKFIPDFYPLAPGGLPTKAVPLKDFTEAGISDTWDFGIFYRKETKMISVLQDRLGADAFLSGAGRVVALLNYSDFRLIEGSGAAGKTASDDISFPEKGVTLSYKVMVVPRTADISTVAHEVVHTLPGLWSGSQMQAECGANYHNDKGYWANGIRLVVGGTPGERRNKDNSAAIMGPERGHPEDLTSPFTGSGMSEKMVKNLETNKEENQFFIEHWITQCTYGHLANVLRQPPDPPMLLVRGYLGRHEGKYSAYLNPFYDVMGHEDLPQDFMGDFAIVVKDAAGATLATYRFVPDWILPGQTLARDLTAFHFRVPLLPGLAQIDLTGPGGVLASRKLSTQTPRVRIIIPSASEPVTPREGRVMITFTGRSAEAGKNVVYTILYSDDGGQTWDERVFETPETTVPIQLSRESKRHAFKVIATDGSRSAEAVANFTAP